MAAEPEPRYNEADLLAKYLGTFRGDNFAVFAYPPQRYERFGGHNDTTTLVLDFKRGDPTAIAIASDWAAEALGDEHVKFRDTLGCRFIMAAPRSQAGVANVPCEALAAHLAATFPWLQHVRGALVRTESLLPSHKGGARDADLHAQTMGLALPPPSRERYECPECDKPFRSVGGLNWHNGWAHPGRPTPATGEGVRLAGASVIVVDDVMTSGATVDGCRGVLLAADAAQVVGFFLGKTGSW